MSLIALAACGESGPPSTVGPSPPAREMKIVMSGALAGPFQIIQLPENWCAGKLADDPRSVDYILTGHVEGTSRDIGITLNFSVRRSSKSGS